ncbi:helix-turn-helix domain-containing protein [Streptomyces sp. NPDC048211]|uniref:helix-turn-helix domain-containing protein n=1 Tax=Streptomyces sp. NPDC048211 TaxID=3365516 RepID=UPI00371E9CCF
MSVQDPSPAAWRYCGDQLKRWRTRAGVSREELGAAAKYAPDTVKSMEQGVRMPTPQLLDAADELFRAEGLLSAAKQYVRRERFPARAQDFMARESEARTHWSYETVLVPGLLQTETYARRLIGNHSPLLDEETVEARVSARMERQQILYRKPLVALSFVVYEAVLRGPHIDKGQLLQLVKLGRLRNVSVQVLPFERAVPAALLGPVVLLESRDHERLAFDEGQFDSRLSSDPDMVSVTSERLSMIRMEALGVRESADFIERMADGL